LSVVNFDEAPKSPEKHHKNACTLTLEFLL
jgi:hypothetical protein